MTTKRINPTNAWKLSNCNSTFTMKFANPTDMRKACEAMEKSIEAIGRDEWMPMYTDLWLQDLSDCITNNSFDICSALTNYSFAEYIPAMCKAVAETLPEVEFEGLAVYDDLKCYCVHVFDFAYNGNTLHIESEFKDDDCGYFCPDCGEWVAFIDEEFESDEIECEWCEEIIKVSKLEKREAECKVMDITIR